MRGVALEEGSSAAELSVSVIEMLLGVVFETGIRPSRYAWSLILDSDSDSHPQTLNDMARMGLLSEGELEWGDVLEEAAGDTGGALVLGWASRRRWRRLQRRKRSK